MTTPIPERPKVGLALLVVRGDSILLAKRKGSHGAGQYATPGGHMEYDESFEDGILREVAEECGPYMLLTRPRFLCLTNLRTYLPKHYVDIAFVSHWVTGRPQVMEPDKCEGWEWHPLDRLPDNRFGSIDNYVIAYSNNQPYFASA